MKDSTTVRFNRLVLGLLLHSFVPAGLCMAQPGLSSDKIRILGSGSAYTRLAETLSDCQKLKSRVSPDEKRMKRNPRETSVIIRDYLEEIAHYFSLAGKLDKSSWRVFRDPDTRRDSIYPGAAILSKCSGTSEYLIALNSDGFYRDSDDPLELDNYLLGLMAHEVAHIVQETHTDTSALKSLSSKEIELHADYLAGWCIYRFLNCRFKGTKCPGKIGYIDSRREMLEKAMRQFVPLFTYGDDVTKSYDNPHGAPELRLFMVLSGFRVGSKNLQEVFNDGIPVVQQKVFPFGDRSDD